MPHIRIELDRLHPTQQKIVAEAALRNVWISGRQSGKTALAHHLLVTTMLAGKSCGLFAPTYKTASDGWRTLKSRLHDAIAESDEQERRLRLVGDGQLEVWSLDSPDSGRGRQYDLIVIDEAGQVRDLTAGDVTVRSRPGEGVVIEVRVPIRHETYSHTSG